MLERVDKDETVKITVVISREAGDWIGIQKVELGKTRAKYIEDLVLADKLKEGKGISDGIRVSDGGQD